MPPELPFKVGDRSVPPHHGVGEVTAIEEREIAGHEKTCYTRRIVGSGTKVRVATDAGARLGLRKVVSRREAARVLDVLRDREIAVTSRPWSRRYRECTGMLHSGSRYEVAKVGRDLSLIRGGEELSFGERGLLDTARDLLVTEVSVARRGTQARVEDEIEALLEPSA